MSISEVRLRLQSEIEPLTTEFAGTVSPETAQATVLK